MRKHPAFTFLLQILTSSSSRFSPLNFYRPASNNVTVIAKPHRALKAKVVSAIGVLICAWSAVLLSFLFNGNTSRTIVPIAFLGIVVLVSIRCGIAAGVLGSAVAALIFATFLYAPLGSPQIANKAARANVGWLLLGGLAISYLLGSPSSGRPQRHN